MSSFAYATVTRKRVLATPGKSFTTEPPGTTGVIDGLAALFPVEVLTIHAAILALATETKTNAGEAVTTITKPDLLVATFWILIVLSMVLYALGRGSNWIWSDVIRILIPPGAFVLWTMLQRTTAFDAVFPDADTAWRTVVGLPATAALVGLAAAMATKADQASR